MNVHTNGGQNLNKASHQVARILTEALNITVSIYRYVYVEAIKAIGTTLHGAGNSNGYVTTLHATQIKQTCM